MGRFRLFFLTFVLALMPILAVHAQEGVADKLGEAAAQTHDGEMTTPGEPANHAGAEHEGAHPAVPAVKPEFGTWISPLVRPLFGVKTQPEIERDAAGNAIEVSHSTFESIKYDYFVLAILAMLGLGLVFSMAAKKGRLRPQGKAASSANAIEAAVDGFRGYVVGIMGEELGRKYASMISAFFFTILIFNYLGLIPGLISPSANLNTTLGLALIAFLATHFIAIKEVGVGAWFNHFVGEPIWLAWLNFPLHIIGELIKPASLAIRLMCNVFGEEMVAGKLVAMAVGLMALIYLPIPLQLPMLLLGTFFGALQALVFSTLLAIYISILATHHDHSKDAGHNGHTEHDGHGFHAVPEQGSLA